MSSIPGSLSTDPGTFTDDPRIYFDQAAEAHRVEDDDGVEWEFNIHAKQWSKIDTTNTAEEQAWSNQYKKAGTSDETTANVKDRKRKAGEQIREDAAKRQRENEIHREKLSKAVYVTGLPLDTDVSEIYAVFSKLGLIDEDWRTDEPRIKLYYDDEGEFKGECLIIYLKPESVTQAIRMLDKTDLRRGKLAQGDLRVKIAPRTETQESQPSGGRAARKPLTDKERQKIAAKKIEMEKRLDWESDDEDEPKEPEYPADRMIVIKGMFTPAMLTDGEITLKDLKSDVKEGVDEHGTVTALVVWDGEPEGIVTVRYSQQAAAVKAVNALNGRWYDGRRLEARLSTEADRFHKAVKPVTENAV